MLHTTNQHFNKELLEGHTEGGLLTVKRHIYNLYGNYNEISQGMQDLEVEHAIHLNDYHYPAMLYPEP